MIAYRPMWVAVLVAVVVCAAGCSSSSSRSGGSAAGSLNLTWHAAAGPPGADGVADISCPGANRCVALVDISPGRVSTFDGSSWTQPRPIGAIENPDTIACARPAVCFVTNRDGTSRATYDGVTWTDQGPPVSAFAISCPAGDFCVAVSADGRWASWDGTEWVRHGWIDTPVTLHTLDCTSASFCLAVGYDTSYVFDGASWARSLPTPAGHFDDGTVGCSSATDCTLVADANGNGDVKVAHWDSRRWTTVPAHDKHGYADLACRARFCVYAAGDGIVETHAGTKVGYATLVDGVGSSVSCSPEGWCVAVPGAGSKVFTATIR